MVGVDGVIASYKVNGNRAVDMSLVRALRQAADTAGILTAEWTDSGYLTTVDPQCWPGGVADISDYLQVLEYLGR